MFVSFRISILHFKNERVIKRSSELFPALCLHKTPQILKNLSIKAEEAGILEKRLYRLGKLAF